MSESPLILRSERVLEISVCRQPPWQATRSPSEPPMALDRAGEAQSAVAWATSTGRPFQKPRSTKQSFRNVRTRSSRENIPSFWSPLPRLDSSICSYGFSARDAEEGTSLLTKKGGGTLLGEKLFSEKISARSDPFDPRNSGMPWLGEVATEIPNIGSAFFTGTGGPSIVGDFLPTRKTTWIEKGVVRNLGYDRYWARKKDVEPTPNPGTDLIIDGEDHSIDDLVKSTERGLLITRFWYIRYVNRQTLQLTGLTRDGVFMIEKGKISHPVMNFRWNESPARAMRNVEMLSQPAAVENYNGVDIVPGMKITNFPVSSLSEAV